MNSRSRSPTKYGITSAPSLGNPDFTSAVVFDRRRAAGTPKARLAYLFPNRDSAQIVLRLRPDLSDSERHRALGLIREAVLETTPRAACKDHGIPAPCFQLKGGSYVVSGVPVVIDGLARALKDALLLLLAVAVGVMALVLVDRLPVPPAAPAAGRGARRRGAHLRALRPGRGLADDGLDRRAADPDRPRRRLRDPVPGPLRRGGGRRLGRGGGSTRRRRRRRPDDRHRLSRDRRRLPGAASLADPDGSQLRPAARRRHRDRLRARPHGRLRGSELALTKGRRGHPGACATSLSSSNACWRSPSTGRASCWPPGSPWRSSAGDWGPRSKASQTCASWLRRASGRCGI